MNFNFGKDIKSLMPLISDISICLNLVYADVKGNIGYHLTGKIPIRKNKKEGSYPKILEKEEDLITNYIPFDELPSLENPERGYIVTCNNLIISDNYKYILQGQFFGDHRYRSIENNILSHLKNGKKINTQFVIDKVINNVHDVVCEDLLKSIKELNTKEKYKSKFMEKFSEFNCQMERESKEALIYNAFITELVNSLPYISKEKINNIQDTLLLNDTKKIPLDTDERANYLYYFFQKFINDSNICQKEFNQSCSEFLDSIYNKAIKYLTNKLGRDREKYWKWKNLNYKIYEHVPFAQIPFFDLISSRRVKTNGNNFTPKVAGNHMSDRKYESILSSNLKFVSNIKNPNEFFISIDCGNSGKIFSEHYDDLCYSHEEGKLINYNYEKKRDYTLKFFNK
jgi:penicillin amidase